jgi:uncharacterized protein with PQ loop repeat
MIHDPANALAAASPSDTKLRGLLGGMSVFTMIMTVPQVLAIWVGHQAAGVSILSWSAYFVSAVLWLWFGIRRHDRNIYLSCLGWIALDQDREPNAPNLLITQSCAVSASRCTYGESRRRCRRFRRNVPGTWLSLIRRMTGYGTEEGRIVPFNLRRCSLGLL